VSGTTIRTGEVVRKRRSRMPWLLWLLGIALMVLWWTLYQSSLFLVEDIKVVGNHRLDSGKVIQMANVHLGEPLISVNPKAVSKDLSKIAQIKSAQVERGWPHSVLITVTERSPVAVVKSGAGFNLIDDAGMLAGRIGKKPKKMYVIDATPSTPAMLAAVQIALVLPTRWKVVTISNTNSKGVIVELDKGQTIIFGTGDQPRLKVKVANSLLLNKYKNINVSAPLSPTVQK